MSNNINYSIFLVVCSTCTWEDFISTPTKKCYFAGVFICNFPNLLIAPFFPLSSFPLSSLEADEVISQLVTV